MEVLSAGLNYTGFLPDYSINLGENVNGEEIILNNIGEDGSILIKYAETEEGEYKIQWIKNMKQQMDYVETTTDNEILTVNNDDIVIKYDKDGNKEWIMGGMIDFVLTDYGEIIVVEETDEYLNLGTDINGEEVKIEGNNLLIIKYVPIETQKLIVKQEKAIAENESSNNIEALIATRDGCHIVGGYFEGNSVTLGKDMYGNEVVLKSNSNNNVKNGYIVKYDENEIVQWAKAIGGESDDIITSVAETNDGGCIVVGNFKSDIIQLEENKILNNDTNENNGMVIKYDSQGKLEWAKAIEGEGDDNITAVTQINDGGIVVAGYFNSNNLNLENLTLEAKGNYDAMIIKYSKYGELEWAKDIGTNEVENIASITSSKDGGFVVIGKFESERLDLGQNNIIESLINSDNNAMIIKYNSEGDIEWTNIASSRGNLECSIESITQLEDESYIIVGYFHSSIWLGKDIHGHEVYMYTPGGSIYGIIIKYNKNGELEKATSISGLGQGYFSVELNSVSSTKDGGFIVGAYFDSDYINLHNTILEGAAPKEGEFSSSNGVIIKYSKDFNVEYATALSPEVGTTFDPEEVLGIIEDCSINAVAETNEGKILAGKVLSESKVSMYGEELIEELIKEKGTLIEAYGEMGVAEVQELTVENKLKEFKITTEVEEVNGEKGGEITGEGKKPYKTVKYNETYGEKEEEYIIMKPQEDYDLAKVTINGETTENYEKQQDGSYKLLPLSNVKEDKHIVVTYIKPNSKLTIKKVGEDDKPLAGAKFRVEQRDKRKEPVDVIEDIVQNEQEYAVINKSSEISEQTLEEMVGNGPKYLNEKQEEIEYVFNENHEGSEYYFVQDENHAYEPTNSVNYEGNSEKDLTYTTAHSYFEIDLTTDQYKNEDYVVVVNARVSSKEYNHYGYATITQTEDMPYDWDEDGQFMYISGEVQAEDYTSMVLEGGKKYYLHLCYYKNYSDDVGEDKIVINSIKLYSATSVSYNFEEQQVEREDKKYVSTNAGKANTIASSYIPINLEEYDGQTVALVVNAEISSQGYDAFGFAVITDTIDRPESYYDGTTVINDIYGEVQAIDYTAMLEGGTIYYLHFVYEKGTSGNGRTDTFTINSVKVYETKQEKCNFDVETVQNGETTTTKYVSNNQGYVNTQAQAYVKINLIGYEGKYDVIVNAEISSEKYGDYGYAVISQSAEEVDTYDNFIEISGDKTAQNYVTTVDGEAEYYLHFIYEKNDTVDGGTDTFTINDIKVVLNGDHLYKTEVTTDNLGQAILSLPTDPSPIYDITEIESPEGYEVEQNVKEYEMKNEEVNEITFEDTKKPKLIVHHYKDGTGVDDVEAFPVADDEIYYGTSKRTDGKYQEYETKPKTDLNKYELVKSKIPDNWKGTYDPQNINDQGEIIVTYYYTDRKIPLTVHHYIEGTTNGVLLKTGTNAKDKVTVGTEGQEYNTSALSEDLLSEKYKLVNTPSNANGRYEYPEVEVTYEYRLKTYEVTTKVQLHEETDSLGETKQVAGGSILGEKDTPYETVEHGESNTRDIIATPEENYQVKDVEVDGKKLKSITINGVQIDENQYTVDEETGAVTLNKIDNITQNQEIEVEFEKIPAEVIVNHYIYDENLEEPHTTNKVHLADGTEAPEQRIKGTIGDIYGTSALENIQGDYELYEEPINSSGIMNTRETYVNYYYVYKGANITQNIEKDGSDKITSKDEEINYKIKYNATIENYTGKATVTIVDTLPYKLDLYKMKEAYNKVHQGTQAQYTEEQNQNWLQEVLNGGQYEEGTQKITWTETYEKINTLEEEDRQTEITIEKNMMVIFQDVNVKEKTIINSAKGSIYLDETQQEQTTQESTHTTETQYIKDVKVTKTWEHGANIYEKPSKIEIILKNGEQEVGKKIIGNENNWTYTFTNLPKYDENTGEEIQYTVEEKALEGENLEYYKRK